MYEEVKIVKRFIETCLFDERYLIAAIVHQYLRVSSFPEAHLCYAAERAEAPGKTGVKTFPRPALFIASEVPAKRSGENKKLALVCQKGRYEAIQYFTLTPSRSRREGCCCEEVMDQQAGDCNRTLSDCYHHHHCTAITQQWQVETSLSQSETEVWT